MSREHLQVNIRCPECGETGKLNYSANDYPFMRKEARSIDGVVGNIKVRLTDDEQFQMTCGKCGHEW